MIKANGKVVKISGDGLQIIKEATMNLFAVCTQLAKDRESKYVVLDKMCAAVKAAMEHDDGIEGGGGSDE